LEEVASLDEGVVAIGVAAFTVATLASVLLEEEDLLPQATNPKKKNK
jgi:hypothetical protein